MDETPAPPPEGLLIRLAREGAGIRVADAAKAAGVSIARWSQVENGRETRAGRVTAVRAKPGTIAHMAGAVGITPERLEAEGHRPDAAGILREILRREGETSGRAAGGPGFSTQPPAAPSGPPRLPHLWAPELEPYLPAIREELTQARNRYGRRNITGDEAFPDNDLHADAWDTPLLTEEESVRQIAWLRQRAEQRRRARSGAETALWRR